MEASVITSNLKATSAESQIVPLFSQIKLLESEVEGLRDLNKLLVKNEAEMRTKMTEAVTELQDKVEMFNGAEDSI